MGYQKQSKIGVSFKEYIGDMDEIMKQVGYVKRHKTNDYVLNWGASSRFHATIKNKRSIVIHLDITIEGKHVVFRTPMALNEERKRIFSVIKERHKSRLKKQESIPVQLSPV